VTDHGRTRDRRREAEDRDLTAGAVWPVAGSIEYLILGYSMVHREHQISGAGVGGLVRHEAACTVGRAVGFRSRGAPASIAGSGWLSVSASLAMFTEWHILTEH
jgi:hypothetical protein